MGIYCGKKNEKKKKKVVKLNNDCDRRVGVDLIIWKVGTTGEKCIRKSYKQNVDVDVDVVENRYKMLI